MKISKKLSEIVAESEIPSTGTIFYSVTSEQLADAFSYDNKSNLWMMYSVKEYGFDAIDVSSIWGSAVVGDILYLCKTNGQPILVNDREIEPDSALTEESIEDLAEFIVESTPEIIRKMITDDEFNFQDINECALALMQDGYDFTQIVKDAQEVNIVGG